MSEVSDKPWHEQLIDAAKAGSCNDVENLLKGKRRRKLIEGEKIIISRALYRLLINITIEIKSTPLDSFLDLIGADECDAAIRKAKDALLSEGDELSLAKIQTIEHLREAFDEMFQDDCRLEQLLSRLGPS